MKKTNRDPLKPMLEAVQELQADSRLKSAAYNFLKTDLTKLRSLKAIEEAVSGLDSCLMLLAPLGDNYRKALESRGKLLDKIVRRRLIPAHEWGGRMAELQEAWISICSFFEKHVKPEVWGKVAEITTKVFDSIRELRD